MSFYGVQLDVQTKRVIHDIKMKFSKVNGGLEVRKMTHCFKECDAYQRNEISVEEFVASLHHVGIIYPPNEIQVIGRYFQSSEGFINYAEFLKCLRGPVPERRMNHIVSTFKVLDIDNSSALNVIDISAFIHDHVLYELKLCNGHRKEMLDAFFNLFECCFDKNGDAHISMEEWVSFYSDLSATYSSDDVFCAHLTRMWGVKEGDSTTTTEQIIRMITTCIRYKLINKTTGVNDEFLLMKIFREFENDRVHDKEGSFDMEQLQGA